MGKITATIITLNEEKRIEKCLQSIYGVADEIIVVDSYSTDKTADICKKYGCTITQRRFNGYGAQKQYAVSLSSNSYILSIDADEVLDDELRESLLKLKEGKFTHRIYGFSRLNHYGNKAIRHSGWYPDFQIRLFDKRYASWNLRDVNETVIFPGTLRPHPIKGHLLHFQCNTPEEYKFKEHKYAAINAAILINENKRPAFIAPYFMWIKDFTKTYIFKLGILDGKEGKNIALINASASFLKQKLARKR